MLHPLSILYDILYCVLFQGENDTGDKSLISYYILLIDNIAWPSATYAKFIYLYNTPPLKQSFGIKKYMSTVNLLLLRH